MLRAHNIRFQKLPTALTVECLRKMYTDLGNLLSMIVILFGWLVDFEGPFFWVVGGHFVKDRRAIKLRRAT